MHDGGRPPTDEIQAIRRAYHEALDLLLFLSDEIEMGRLPSRDSPSALRMAAALVALMMQLS